MLDLQAKPRSRPAPRESEWPRARLVLLGALVAAAAVGGVLAMNLSQSAPRLAGVDATRQDAFSTVLFPTGSVCQSGEVVPSDAAVVSVVVGTFGAPGQPLELTLRDSRGVRRGRVVGPYADGARVNAPLSGPARAGAATLCIRNRGDHPIGLGGIASSEGKISHGTAVHVRDHLAVAWYRSGSESWWSVAPQVAERAGRVKASWIGTWTIWAALAAVLACGLLAVAVVMRSSGAAGRWPFAVWACGLVALLNALAWGVLTPPFQVPDEYKHVAYADTVAATGRPPTSDDVPRGVAPDVIAGLDATWFRPVVFDVRMRPPWTSTQDAAARRIVDRPLGRRGSAEGATYYAPLYYAAAAAAAEADGSGNVLDRMTLMRMVSAVFAGFAALFAALFVRELLPSRPWAWAAGGMVAAFQPMLGFMSGGVNNDSLLFAASAALLWAVARALRRGLTTRLAVACGAAIAIGVLAKATMVALVPLACVGLALAAWAEGRAGRPIPWRALSAFVLAAAAPLIAYSVVNGVVWGRGANPLGGGAIGAGASNSRSAAAANHPWTLQELLSYTWQFYLPRLPFLNDQFGAAYPAWDVWFKGWIGRFGWLDTPFSPRFYRDAFAVWTGAALLAGVALWRYRAVVRRRWREAVTYLVGAISVVAVIHYVGYDYLLRSGVGFEQARYLLVLLPLYAGFAGIAAIGAGRRVGPVVAGALVVLAFGNSLGGMLITAARYYG